MYRARDTLCAYYTSIYLSLSLYIHIYIYTDYVHVYACVYTYIYIYIYVYIYLFIYLFMWGMPRRLRSELPASWIQTAPAGGLRTGVGSEGP